MPTSDSSAVAPDFDRAWGLADRVPGWLTKEQGRLLFEEAAATGPAARLLEIGSHQGRSTVLLGQVAMAAGGEVIAIDPFVDGRLFGGLPTRAKFRANLERAGVAAVVRPVEEYSTRARSGWSEDVDLLYIDGKHDVWTFSDDLRWRAFIPPGASILVHDAFSSIGVTLGILLQVLPSRDLTYVRRVGSMALFRLHPPGLVDRLRIIRELPWWLRNVGLKILLRLRLRPVARLLGHRSRYDPY
jgi:predicted O-methyltransferase YrrM